MVISIAFRDFHWLPRAMPDMQNGNSATRLIHGKNNAVGIGLAAVQKMTMSLILRRDRATVGVFLKAEDGSFQPVEPSMSLSGIVQRGWFGKWSSNRARRAP